MGLHIGQFLPQDMMDAALNANSPSSSNPYATQADTLYNSDGTVGASRSVTLTDSIEWMDVNDFTIKSDVTGAATTTFSIKRANDTKVFQIRTGGSGDGYIEISNAAGGTRIHFHSNSPSYINQQNGFVLGSNAIDGVALFEMVSTTKGFLPPRMTAAQASSITAVNGLTLYVTSTDATFTAVGLWCYVAGTWTQAA